MKKCRQSCVVGGLIWIVTAGLGLLLLAQIALAGFLLFGKSLPLPTRQLSERIANELGDGWRVELESGSLDRNGVFRLAGLRLFHRANYGPVLSVERLAIDLFLPALLVGHVNPEQVNLHDVVVFEEQSHFAEPRAILSVSNILAERSGDRWQIRDAHAHHAGISLLVHGTLIQPQKGPSTGTTSGIKTAHSSLTNFLNQIQPVIEGFPEATLQVEIRPGIQQSTEFIWTTIAEAVTPLPGMELQGVRAGGTLRLGERSVQGSISVTMDHLQSATINAEDIDLRTGFDFAITTSELSVPAVLLAAERFVILEESLDQPVFRIPDPFEGRIRAYGHTRIRGARLRITTDLDPVRLDGTVYGDGYFDLPSLLAPHPEVAATLEGRLSFGEAPYLRASLNLENGGVPVSASFSIDAPQPDILGLRGQRLTGHGHLSRDELIVDHFLFDTRRYNLAGSLRLNLRTSDYHFGVRGGFYPGEINGWFEDWWDDLWGRFEFSRPPGFDFYVRGNIRASQDRDLFGGLEIPPTTISGFPVDRARVRLWGDERFLTLQLVDAAAPAGTARGKLHYFYNHEQEKLVARAWDLHAEATIPPDFPLLGDAVESSLSHFRFTGPSQIRINGWNPTDDAPPEWSRHRVLTLIASTDNPVTVYGFAADWLAFQARLRDELLTIDPVDFGYGGGTGEAEITWNPSEARPLAVDLELTGADPRSFIEASAPLQQYKAFQLEESSRKSSIQPKLDLSLEVAGDPAQLTSFEGSLRGEVISDELGRVHLLGMLSRVLESAPPPFNLGSLRFFRAKANVRFVEGRIRAEDIEIFSDSSRVKITGDYVMTTGQLNMGMRIYLFQEIGIPVVGFVARIFQPLSRILDFNLTGTIDNQSVRFALDPRGSR